VGIDLSDPSVAAEPRWEIYGKNGFFCPLVAAALR
jgi:hypothetical protein